jgi:tetratricopeptide (TPR) repeat protein
LAAAAPAAAVAAPEVGVEPVLEELPVQEAAIEPVADASAASDPSQATGEAVHEVDLSDEWASLLDGSQAAEAPVEAAGAPEAVEEFEISPEVVEPETETVSGSELPEAMAPSPSIVPPADEPAVAEFEIPIEVPEPEALEASVAEAAAEVPQESQEAPVEAALELPAVQEEPATEIAVPEAPKAVPVPSASAAKDAKPGEPEFEVEQEYELVLDAEPLVPAYDQKPPETPIKIQEQEPEPAQANAKAPAAAKSGLASDQFLADLASEIDQMGIDQLSPSFSQPAASAETTKKVEKAVSPTEAGPLKEVFDEFRAELGEMGAEEEDLETHYNLGIAFREMGLLEEAISEFQKVAKANEQGRPFRYAMQCCTLLGLAFMDRGQPAIAAIWYERALRTPDVNPESALALRYDLGVAQESAGESEAALKSFSQVYAMNIDYRDVGERIAALQKPLR